MASDCKLDTVSIFVGWRTAWFLKFECYAMTTGACDVSQTLPNILQPIILTSIDVLKEPIMW